MSGPELVGEVAMLLLGGFCLVEGLLKLATMPLIGVLIVLSAMSFLLLPAGRLCGADQRRRRGRRD